ncbi:MAG TPA: hypothetical protein VIJ86_00780 [Acidimicrobiales bacterium]
MVNSLQDIDSVLEQVNHVDETVSTTDLRQWRSELVRSSVFVSYAVSVLSLDIEVLNRCRGTSSADIVQSLVDELPDVLATAWVGGGWSLSPDASSSVAAAAELTMDQADGLLGLHAQMAGSDLSDRTTINELLVRVTKERDTLVETRVRLEERIRSIQSEIKHRYSTGRTTVDEWLT